MKFKVPAVTNVARFLLAVALSAIASASLQAQIAASNPPTNPPMWDTDPTVTGTDDWAQWKKNCHDLTTDFGKDTLLSCATSTFRSRPFHFVAQSIVPGSGVGGGGYYGRDLNSDIWQNRLEFTGVMTIRQFWLAKRSSPLAVRTSAHFTPTKILHFSFTRATNRCRICPSMASVRIPMSTMRFISVNEIPASEACSRAL
jgi:hypothetical protein